MGRSGGSGGGHHSSSGGHHVSRSSGGHRVSSSRSSGSSSFSRSSRPSGHRPPPPAYHHPHSHYHHTTVYYGNRGYYRPTGAASVFKTIFTIIAIFFALLTITLIFNAVGDAISRPETSITREKLTGSPTFNNNCIVDETGEFSSISKTASKLKDFYDKTGVQPYIIWKDYDPTLTSDSAKESWALDYYDNNQLSENTFMYVYFEEEYDYGDGYMCYVNGKQSVSVMDAEAVEIFWGYVDRYWEDDVSTDQLFVNVFTKTGDVIMYKPSNRWDVISPIVVALVICVICFAIAQIIKARAKAKHQEAEDTQRILNTPLSPVGSGSSNAAVEDALSKYGDNNM